MFFFFNIAHDFASAFKTYLLGLSCMPSIIKMSLENIIIIINTKFWKDDKVEQK